MALRTFLLQFFLLFVLLFPNILQAKPPKYDFQDGFVITKKNDTIQGKISNVHKSGYSDIFFRYPNGADTTFNASQLLGYQIANAEFISVPLPHATKSDTIHLFSQVLVDGYASLYKTKIKVDFVTPAEVAYLCKKYSDSIYFPAGKIKSLAHFFSDYPTLHSELKNHHHLYSNTIETKIQLFNHYNAWKRHQLDSLAHTGNIQTGVPQKVPLAIALHDSSNLTLDSKMLLDHIAEKLRGDSNSRLVIEYIFSSSSEQQIRWAMRAVIHHLNPYAERIEQKLVTTSQGGTETNAPALVAYYFYR